jgi:cyclohexanecarboxylate-CoA ligase
MTSGRRVIPAATAAEYRRRGWWRDRTLVEDFLDQVAERPDATAVVSYRSGGGDPERHTYAELERLSRRFAGALIDLGVAKGDVVSLQLPNRWEFPALVYGILRAGAVVNPLVPIFRHRELEFILGRTAARVLVVPDQFRHHDHAAMARDLQATVETLEHVVVLGDGTEGALAFQDHFVERPWEEDPALGAELEARRAGPDDLVQIQFTSGTTGEPKGVLHSHNTIYSGSRVIDEVYGLGGDDVCFMASTLAHQTGFGYGMVKPLSLGSKIIYQDLWDADQMLDAVEAEGVSWTVSATAFVLDMIAAQRRRPRKLDTFRYFICGGAAIPPHVVEETREVLGAELVAVWGMTENMVVTTTRPGDPVSLVSDSDGTPVDWMEIRILDPDGAPVAVGEAGDLQCRGPSQALGYFHRPDLYAAASPDGDWFDTGDVARLRPDGGIRIAGREHPGGRGRGRPLHPPPAGRGGHHRPTRRPAGGTGLRRGHPRREPGPHPGRADRLPGRVGHGQAVLARTAGGGGRNAQDPVGQDPEVQAAGAGARPLTARRAGPDRSAGCCPKLRHAG